MVLLKASFCSRFNPLIAYSWKSIGSDSIDLYRFRLNLNLEAAIENQQASDKAKSIESDPIDSLYTAGDTLSDFLTVADDGSDVTIAIDANGDSSGTDLTITLIGIGTGSLDLAALTADDNLVVI